MGEIITASLPCDMIHLLIASIAPMASPSGLIWHISIICSASLISLFNSFVYLPMCGTVKIFRVDKGKKKTKPEKQLNHTISMDKETTFSIIKPDAMRQNNAGRIMSRITEAGFRISALKMLKMTPNEAESFYEIHRERPFFAGLVEFMSSGPVIVMVLSHPDAVNKYRSLIGATDPALAAAGTIRAEFGTDRGMNAVHGSDSPENAFRESSFFFPLIEIF